MIFCRGNIHCRKKAPARKTRRGQIPIGGSGIPILAALFGQVVAEQAILSVIITHDRIKCSFISRVNTERAYTVIRFIQFLQPTIPVKNGNILHPFGIRRTGISGVYPVVRGGHGAESENQRLVRSNDFHLIMRKIRPNQETIILKMKSLKRRLFQKRSQSHQIQIFSSGGNAPRATLLRDIGLRNEPASLLSERIEQRQKKWVSYLHRTATTTYPCCLPALGDSAGAGRTRLTHGTKVNLFPDSANPPESIFDF